MQNVFADFLINKGLYGDSVSINEENIEELIDLVSGKVKIRIFCPSCKMEQVFIMEPIIYFRDINNCKGTAYLLGQELSTIQNTYKLTSMPTLDGKCKEKEWYWYNTQCENATRILHFHFKCSMDNVHSIDYFVKTEGNVMRKIGQFPSIADLTFPELDIYKKVLSEQDYKEMKRAFGLYADGIGVGSYVYLRRIFERILCQAREKADDEINDEKFMRARVGEKIKMLSNYLPDILVLNKQVYNILSKGIHELSDEECIKFFPVLRECIFMILNQWEEKRKEEETINNIHKEIAKVVNEVSES